MALLTGPGRSIAKPRTNGYSNWDALDGNDVFPRKLRQKTSKSVTSGKTDSRGASSFRKIMGIGFLQIVAPGDIFNL